MNKIIKKILVIVTGGFLISFITVISVLWVFSNNLPDYKFLKNYKAPVSSKVYSGDGELVNDFSSEKRIFVPYSAISQTVINAFLSAEDKNFFDHPEPIRLNICFCKSCIVKSLSFHLQHPIFLYYTSKNKIIY